MKKENSTQKLSFVFFSVPAKLKTVSQVVRNYRIGLLIALFVVISVPLQAQLCRLTAVGSRSGCTPFRIVIKNECIGVDSLAFYGSMPLTLSGDSIVGMLDDNNVKEGYSSMVRYACYDSSKTLITRDYIEYRVNPRNPVSISKDSILLGEYIEVSRAGEVKYTVYFGDGTSYADYFHFGHVYADTGIYHIKIPPLKCGNTQNFDVHVLCPSIRPNISVPLAYHEVCINEPVTFGVNNIQDIYRTKRNFTFIFEDTVYASSKNFTRTFSKAGDYPVKMKLTDVCNQEYVYYDTIHVKEHLPVYLYGSDRTICPGVPNTFSLSDHSIVKTRWNMGDGFIVDSMSFLHTYQNTGTYLINIMAFNGCGDSSSVTSLANVKIDPPSCSVYFNAQKRKLCIGEEATFSYGKWCDFPIKTHLWNLGDGFTSTSDTVKHGYQTSGIYPLTLTLSSGCSEAIYYDTVFVGNDILCPDMKLVSTVYSPMCPGGSVSFYADPNGCPYNNVVSYKWNFGDGNEPQEGSNSGTTHAYLNSGIYPASVDIMNKCGVSTTLRDTVDVTILDQDYFPEISLVFDSTLCTQEPVQINVPGLDLTYYITQYVLEFGDGHFGHLYPQHIYEKPGNYTVILHAFNRCGAYKTFSKNITVFEKEVCDNYKIIAQNKALIKTPVWFSYHKSANCMNKVQSVLWNFGDGQFSIHPWVFHSYKHKGIYPVSLTITNNCGNSKTFYDTVAIVKNMREHENGRKKSDSTEDDVSIVECGPQYIIYPVPANDYCMIKRNDGQPLSGNITVSIFNNLGNMISTNKFVNTSSLELRIPLNSFAQGIYILKLNDNEVNESHVVIKE
jgi:PKD repeat protein